ncbi:MAG: MMPL family transporter [Treponema sp.]
MNLKTVLCRRLYKHPRMVLSVILGITFFFALQLPRSRFDNNNFRFVPETDAARIADAEIAQIFGDEVPLLIGIKRSYATVADHQFLLHMQKLDKQLLDLSLVKNVVSLTTTKHIDSKEDSIVSEKLVPEHLTGSPEELDAITAKLRSWDLYNRSLISDDLKATQILVFLNIKQEESGMPETVAVCREVMRIAAEWNCPDAVTYVTGVPVFSEIVNEATGHDLLFLIPIVIAVVVGVLFFSFRRFSGVFLPLLTVIISCIWALGAMALFHIPLSILSTVLPVILIAVGSAYGIHVINHYFDEVTQNTSISKEEHTAQIIAAMSRVLPPVFLAALTTFAGFVSFCFTSVVPIFEFGVFSSFGVLAAFIVSVTLIPSILIIRGPKHPVIRGRFGSQPHHIDAVDRIVADTLMIINAHPRSVLLFAIGCIIFAGLGIPKVVIDNVLMEYFEPEVHIVQADTFIQKEFGGSKLLNLHITTEQPHDIIRPDVLTAIDSLSAYAAENIPEVGKITSIADLIKRLNQVYNADSPPEGLTGRTAAVRSAAAGIESSTGIDDLDTFGFFGDEDTSDSFAFEAEAEPPSVRKDKTYTLAGIITTLDAVQIHRGTKDLTAGAVIDALKKEINYHGAAYYEIPADPAKYGKTSPEELTGLIQNYLLLLAGNTQGFIDDVYAPRALKVNIQLRTVGQQDSEKALAEIMEYIGRNFPPDVRVKPSGTVLIEQSLNTLVVQSQLISLAVSLGIVFIILTCYYRSVAAGIIGIIPLLISIALNFGFMGVAGIKLNIGTAMVASFAIGIGIDYTIHYLAAYHSEYLKHGNSQDFLIHTFYGSGKAILFNAVSVGAGFAVLILSKFNMLSDLGLLIALVMGTSSFASLTVLPTLLSIIKPRFITANR